jgi:threonine dehydrogenase-like Zn-dependent dehydrogenase
MRAAIFNGPHDITVGERPDPVIQEPTDAVVRVVLGCVCGSDLWYYRGDSPHALGPIGHEFIGVVEELGAEVSGVEVGDLVVAPFIFSDMSCAHCLKGSTISCKRGGNFGNGDIDGGQGEAVRVPLAGSTLIPVPGSGHSDEMLRSLLTLSDVMATGHHIAVCAGVAKGDTVAVVGDGAVGLCAALASKRLGAERIIALSRHPGRQKLARHFGATDIVEARGEEANHVVLELTGGIGVDAALECVGTAQSLLTAFTVAPAGLDCRHRRRPPRRGAFRRDVLPQRGLARRAGPGPGLHTGPARRCARRGHQARPGFRLRDRPRAHPRRLPGDG